MVDVDPVLAAIPDFLTWLSRQAPAPLAAAAVEMLGSDLVSCTFVRSCECLQKRTIGQETRSDPNPNVRFVADALLQPFAEQWTRHETTPPAERSVTPARCPACASLPVLAVLREEGTAQSAVLSLGFTVDYRASLPGCGNRIRCLALIRRHSSVCAIEACSRARLLTRSTCEHGWRCRP